MGRGGKIDFEKSRILQEKTGQNFYWVENANGSHYILLNDYGDWDRWGSDVDEGGDGEDDKAEDLFESEKDVAAFHRYQQDFQTAILEHLQDGVKLNSNAKSLLRDMTKRGHSKISMSEAARALGFQDEAQMGKYMAKNKRFADNVMDVINKPVSTLRRAFAPKSTFVDDMIEDAGAGDTADLLAFIITKFGA